MKYTQEQIEDCIAEWANDEEISFDATTRLSNKLAALPAAEAGEQTETVSWPKVRNLLIERCAQVAESSVPTTDGGMAYVKAIAAAIRALKDNVR